MDRLARRFPRYAKLLSLYPRSYRKRYSHQMLQTLADMLDDPTADRWSVWARTMADLPLSIGRQNLLYVGGIMKNETPHYVKRNSLISTALLVPFFVIVLSRTLQHNHLYSSYVLRSSLYITLLIMPALAFLLSAYTFIRWSRLRRISLWKSLLDVRHTWMVVSIGALALLIAIFVPFHDSVHCINGNPVREFRGWHTTVRCIRQG